MNSKNINELINEALAIEHYEAKQAGALGFMARSLVQATLPHKAVKGNQFIRTNGNFSLSLLTAHKEGLPYGSIPRLLIAWVATEAVKTQNRELILGETLSEFMREIGYDPRIGGKRGDIKRFKKQMELLFGCLISCSYTDNELTGLKNILIADDLKLWWQPQNPDQINLFTSTVTLSEKFFNELVSNPIPVDLRALKALKRSPMALDIYSWLTYRNSYLKRPTVIPWEALQLQFGSDYKRITDFRIAFLEQMKKVALIYPEARIDTHERGLLLKPSPTHIRAII